jgi:hypothetical protein
MYYYCIIFQKGSSLQILESTTDFVVQSLVLRLQKKIQLKKQDLLLRNIDAVFASVFLAKGLFFAKKGLEK